MQRRTFMQNSALMGVALMFPQLAFGKKSVDTDGVAYFVDAVEVAYYASKLNPVRLIAGLIFDRIAEAYVEPLAKNALDNLLDGGSVSKDTLNFYSSSSPQIKSPKIEVEPYKASVVVYSRYDRTNFTINRRKEIELELINRYDKERFALIHQYLKDEKLQVKFYNNITTSTVGHDLTPSDLFNIDYIAYGENQKNTHIAQLLKNTNNHAFRELVV